MKQEHLSSAPVRWKFSTNANLIAAHNSEPTVIRPAVFKSAPYIMNEIPTDVSGFLENEAEDTAHLRERMPPYNTEQSPGVAKDQCEDR